MWSDKSVLTSHWIRFALSQLLTVQTSETDFMLPSFRSAAVSRFHFSITNVCLVCSSNLRHSILRITNMTQTIERRLFNYNDESFSHFSFSCFSNLKICFFSLFCVFATETYLDFGLGFCRGANQLNDNKKQRNSNSDCKQLNVNMSMNFTSGDIYLTTWLGWVGLMPQISLITW